MARAVPLSFACGPMVWWNPTGEESRGKGAGELGDGGEGGGGEGGEGGGAR